MTEQRQPVNFYTDDDLYPTSASSRYYGHAECPDCGVKLSLPISGGMIAREAQCFQCDLKMSPVLIRQ